MREKTVTTKIYVFAELSDEAKETAIQGLADVNRFDGWWDSTYRDAATIGLKIGTFSDDHCNGEWTEEAQEVAALIQEHHGDACETHKDATVFLADLETAHDDFEDTDEYEELCWKFKKKIREDYRIMLQKEYQYLGSKEAIIETIQANEDEFLADGTHY